MIGIRSKEFKKKFTAVPIEDHYVYMTRGRVNRFKLRYIGLVVWARLMGYEIFSDAYRYGIGIHFVKDQEDYLLQLIEEDGILKSIEVCVYGGESKDYDILYEGDPLEMMKKMMEVL